MSEKPKPNEERARRQRVREAASYVRSALRFLECDVAEGSEDERRAIERAKDDWFMALLIAPGNPVEMLRWIANALEKPEMKLKDARAKRRAHLKLQDEEYAEAWWDAMHSMNGNHHLNVDQFINGIPYPEFEKAFKRKFPNHKLEGFFVCRSLRRIGLPISSPPKRGAPPGPRKRGLRNSK